MNESLMNNKFKDIENSLNSAYIKKLAAKFIGQERTIKILYRNIIYGVNTILYGKGGYGKSQLVKELCNYLEIPLSVVTCYRDMPIEALMGPMNMTKVKEESIYEINFNSSPFMIDGILVLEEFTSLDSDTANAIRDIIQEKGYRNKNTFIPYKSRAIVAIGNINPNDLSTTDEMASLYQDRFASHLDMTWIDHSPTSYLKLMEGNNIFVTYEIAFMCQLASKVEISPRTALIAAKLLTNSNENVIEILDSMHVFSSLEINRLYDIYEGQLDNRMEIERDHRTDRSI